MYDIDNENLPKHIAMILDGNRRWARAHGLDPKEGHKEGSQNVKRITKFANKLGVKYLTLYAFSTENWKRTEEEVNGLLFLLEKYLKEILDTDDLENVKITVFGDTSVLSKKLQNYIKEVEEKTKNNTGLQLSIAFNYGGRAEIIRAVKQIAEDVKNGKLNVEDINEEVFSNNLYTKGLPDPDFLIRTSGEIRTSNFLPWQIVYSEFYFPTKHWPEFSEDDLIEAIKEYQKRNRRFGGSK